jgi:archaellum component FlaC
MREEKKRFVLYEYLMYFWKRKHYFLIVPIITMLLVGGAVYFLKKDMPYTGQAVVYTGGVTSPDLTRENNIAARFADEENLEIFVSSKQVKFTKKGNSTNEVEQSLDRVTEKYEDDLIENFEGRLEASKVYLDSLDKRVIVLQKAIAGYNEELKKGLGQDQYEDFTDLLIETEKELSEADATAHRMRSDIEFFEKEVPKILSENVTKSKSYLKEGAAIGLILGLVLTVLLLALLKYLSEGRRYYND